MMNRQTAPGLLSPQLQGLLLLCLVLPLRAAAPATPSAAQQAPATNTAPTQPQSAQEEAAEPPVQGVDMDSLYETGRSLFEQYAPEEVKQDYAFPSREQWENFLPRLEKALQGSSLQDLAALENEARVGLSFIQTWQGAEDLEIWLRERIELIEAAKALAGKPSDYYVQKPQPQPIEPKPPVQPPRPKPPIPQTQPGQQQAQVSPGEPKPQPELPVKSSIPAYDYWFERLRGSRPPGNAAELVPVLIRSFALMNAPQELVWLAEVESTLNPSALSPAGARGLFQLMPETARAFGLSTRLPDERLNPAKSARAAALLLRSLYLKFGDWPLALAAYNAGEGRVRRLLEKRKAGTFAEIAEDLPVETRLYVPRVLATIATRTGVAPEALPAPKR